jgi:hypothetical protein
MNAKFLHHGSLGKIGKRVWHPLLRVRVHVHVRCCGGLIQSLRMARNDIQSFVSMYSTPSPTTWHPSLHIKIFRRILASSGDSTPPREVRMSIKSKVNKYGDTFYRYGRPLRP